MVDRKTIRKVFCHVHGMQRPAVLKWWFQEVFRRQKIKQSNHYCSTTLLSYPRSGNHALRFILESGTFRPTLGAGDCDRKPYPSWMIDRPLFLRKAGSSIAIRELDPVAVKRHQVDDIYLRKHLILVVRDPVECILSHTRNLADHDFKTKFRSEVKIWLSLIHAWQHFPKKSKLLVPYQLLISEPLQVKLNTLSFVFKTYNEKRIRQIELEEDASSLRSVQDVHSARWMLPRKAASGDSKSYYHDMFPQRSELISSVLQEARFSYSDFITPYIDNF